MVPRPKKQTRHSPRDENMLNKALPNPAYLSGMDMRLPEEPKKRDWKKIFKRAGITLAVFVLLAGGWVGWKFVSNSAKIFGWNNLFGLFQRTKLKGEDEGRVNILLAGNSADDPGHGGGNLTDSIMIMSINTNDNTAFLLSVPRDLYVNIPDHGYAKINEAYQDGEQDNFSESGYADGGMGLLEKTISQNFGMSFQYYALVNYSALREGVNAVGGITVNIQSTDPRGLYDPSRDLTTGQALVNLSNGQHTLNGQQALDLARARGDSYGSYGYGRSDYTRTENQRMILIALKDKVSSSSTLANPIKLGELFDSLGNNVKTDMKLAEVKRLSTVTKKIPGADITSASLNNGTDVILLTNYTNKYGQSTLVPKAGIDDYSEIQAYVQKLITAGTKTSSSDSGS
ncbi:MAG TPA: LCP family protein [Candidatus Saccharimonadales bacterium]|nr:LCP family protein [Candidatus Saccharimonadales bacterium]